MNLKKTLTVASLASLAVVGLVSCGGENKPVNPEVEIADELIDDASTNVTLNLSLNYNGASFITYGKNSTSIVAQEKTGTGATASYSTSKTATYSTFTTLDGRTLNAGASLTPVWQDMGSLLNITFKDGAYFNQTSTANNMTTTITAGYQGGNAETVDVLHVANGNTAFNDAVNAGQIINLTKYQKTMPNLWSFFESSQAVYEQMKMGTDNSIYYAPYFDGKDQLEKVFNMNVEMVQALLDDDAPALSSDKKSGNMFKRAASYDTEATISTVYGGTGEGVTKSYIQSMNEQTIPVANADGSAGTIKVTYAKDIASIQNDLAVKNGDTLTTALKNYIDATYGSYIAADGSKLYKTRSEIFTSASACYNADELIALLRCVKTNPNYLTGDKTNTMVPFFPRTGEMNRIRAFFEIGQMFGLRGSNSGEKDNLFFNEAGELVDGRTQEYTYDVLEKLNTLQQEGLFPKNWLYDGSLGKTEFRDNVMKAGTGFMCYDYSNVAGFNSKTTYTETARTTQMEAVLAPVAKWGVQNGPDSTTQLVGYNAEKGVTFTRFSEDNRSLKDGGWAIVAKGVQGNTAKLTRALKLLDYLYSQDGSFLECYGTTGKSDANRLNGAGTNVYASEIKTDDAGVSYPVLTAEYVAEINGISKGSWHNYMARFMGACIGIGNIRSNYLEAQCTAGQEKGMIKLATAEKAGAMYACKTGYNYTTVNQFFISVPTAIALNSRQSNSVVTTTTDLTNFWAQNTVGQNEGSGQFTNVIRYGWQTPTRETIRSKFSSANDTYLKFNALNIGVTPATSNQYPNQYK